MSGNAPSCRYEPDVERTKTIYKRLETDEEFRARVFAKNLAIAEDSSPQRRGETFSEYARRVTPKVVHIADLHGEKLDEAVWYTCKMQRRIIEVVP